MKLFGTWITQLSVFRKLFIALKSRSYFVYNMSKKKESKSNRLRLTSSIAPIVSWGLLVLVKLNQGLDQNELELNKLYVLTLGLFSLVD